MLYPLKFKPYLKFYPYGGRRFVEVLNKTDVPQDRDVAETWEVSDHGEEQSVTLNGPLAGSTLRQLMEEYKDELVGEAIYAQYGDYFPLLIKFLDCERRLPAHMHPNDAHAERLGLKDKGKTEAWYIVKADPGADAWCGSLPGLTPEKFRAAIAAGNPYDGVMKHFPIATDETYFVPPGRLHGLGAGSLAFEVQQNSDAGFAWEWSGFIEAGVIDAETAKDHPEKAIECAYYEDGARESTKYVTLHEAGIERTFCAASRYFVLERWTVSEPTIFNDPASRFNTLTLIAGAASFSGNGQSVTARYGESLMIPAGVEVAITPEGGAVTFLLCYVPDLQRDVIGPLQAAGKSNEEIAWLGSYGRGNDLLPLLGMPQDALNQG